MLTTYLIAETLKTFLAATAVILSFLLLFGGAQESVRHGLPIGVVFQVVPFLIPEMLRFAIPGCLLFAVCSVFGRMSAGHEILAVKAAGVNPFHVIWPVLCLACVLSIATFFLYDVCAAWARPGLKRTMASATDQIIYGYLRSNRSFSSSEISIAVKGVEQGKLIQPFVQFFGGAHKKQSFSLAAKMASISKTGSDNVLRFTCHEGWVEVGEEVSLTFDGDWTYDLDLSLPAEQDANTASAAALRMSELPSQIRREQHLLSELRRSQPARATADAPEIQEIRLHQERLYRLQAETQRRLSNGFGCLCFALVGIPVAIWQRSAENISVFFLCFGPILLVYYPLLVMGETAARAGFFPSLSVWLADGVMLLVGSLLLRWQVRS